MEKVYKFGQSVYVPLTHGGFELVKGVIDGVRRHSTAFSQFIYEVNTCRGCFLCFACDIYESVEDFKSAIDSLVVE